MDRLPDLSLLSHAEKDALIHALWAQVQALIAGRAAQAGAAGEAPPGRQAEAEGVAAKATR